MKKKSVLITGSGRSTRSASRGQAGRSRQVQAEREAKPGARAFIRVHVGSALRFPGKAKSVNSNQKERVFRKLPGGS